MTTVQAPPLAGSTWRRLRLWFALGAVLVLGAVIVTAIASTASAHAPLDPGSPSHNGSRALARLLEQRGTAVSKFSSPGDAAARPAGTTVLVVAPDDLGRDQRNALKGHRIVLIDPDVAALAAFTGDYQSDSTTGPAPVAAGCSWPGGAATGAVTFPSGTTTYRGPGTCYGGAVVITDQLVVLGSADLLRNDQLAHNNIAALDINAISADGTVADVAWLLPGIEDAGTGSPSIWSLFPSWTQRAFWWLLVVGGLVVLWRGRRFGPVVSEPLPVVVRSAELVEGHGRLYRRAQARHRAAELLRAAATTRLASQLGLDRRAGANQVAAALDAVDGRRRATDSLLGPVPVDDQGLVRLANELGELTAGSVRQMRGPTQ